MTQGENNFDGLRAPEVVKPLTPKPEQRPRGKDTTPKDAVTPQPRNADIEDKGKKEQRAAVSAGKPEKSKPPPSPPREVPPPPPPSKPKPPTQPKQPQKASVKRAWLAVPIVVGILLLIWYAESNHTDQEPDRPPTASAATVERGSSVEQMHTTEKMGDRHTPVDSSVLTPTPRMNLAYSTPETQPAMSTRPKPKGNLWLSAFAIAIDGQQHPMADKATIELKHTDSSFTISTNREIPWLLQNIPIGEHRLSLTIAGCRPTTAQSIKVVADATSEVAIALQPLPARVKFVFPVTNTTFSVYNGARFLGTSKTAYNIAPFVPHFLTFKANGWRDKRMKVQLPKPGILYRCPIEMERVEAELRVTVNTRNGDTPASGLLYISGYKPINIVSSIGRYKLHNTGILRLALIGEKAPGKSHSN